MSPWRNVFLLLALCQVQCARDPTGVFVTLTVEQQLAGMINTVELRTYDPSTSQLLEQRPLSVSSGSASTFTFYVQAPRSTRNRVRIEAIGARSVTLGNFLAPSDMGVVNDRAIVTYVEDQVLEVHLTLRGACMVMVGRRREHCGSDRRCNDQGTCVSAEVTNPSRHQW